MSVRQKRAWIPVAVAAVALWGGTTACTAIIGVSDLPPATTTDAGTPDGGVDVSTTQDVTVADVKQVDTGRDAGHPDVTHADVHEAATIDVSPTDVSQKDAPHDTGLHDAGRDAPPTFVVLPTSLEFGDAGGKVGFIACGASYPPTRQLTLTNNGATPLSWWTSLGLGAASPYTLSTSCTPTSTCTLETGDAGTKVITVTGPVVPDDAGIQTYDDTLTVFSSVPDAPATTIPLSASSYGAVLAFSPNAVAFGGQPANTPDGGYPQAVDLENSGNGPFLGTLTVGNLNVDGGLAPDVHTTPEFAVTAVQDDASIPDATLIQVAPAADTTFTVNFQPATQQKEAGASIVLGHAAGTLCAPLPDLKLSGAGTASPISVTSSLNFNTGAAGNGGAGVGCGSAAPPQNIFVKNASMRTGTVNATLALGASSPYTLSFPSGNTLDSMGTILIVVTPTMIPTTAQPGTTFNDILTVTTTVLGDGPSHAVELQMTAAGVVLQAPYTTIPLSSNGLTHFFLTNRGNLVANVTPASIVNGGAPGKFELPGGFSVGPFGSYSVQVNFASGPGPAQGTGTFSVPTNVPTCYPPDNLAGGAWADGALTLSLSAPEASMPAQDGAQPAGSWNGQPTGSCAAVGSGPGASETFGFTVSTSVPQATWTATLTGPDASFFSINPPSGTVGLPPNIPSMVTILSASGVASTSGLSRGQVAFGLNALLHFQFNNHNGMGMEDYYFPINELLNGSFLEWSTSSVSVPEGSVGGATLYNWNRATAGATLASTSEFPFQASPNPQVSQPMSVLVSNHNGTVGDTGSVSITIQPGTATCGPTPAPLVVKLAVP